MPEIHPTAVIGGDVELAEDVYVGPYCILSGSITIDSSTRLIATVHVQGPTRIGAGNAIYPGVCLGFAPQSVRYDHDAPGAGLRIGDHNVLREGMTIHRATADDVPTTIGDHNYFMSVSHAGHDARVGNHCIVANGALLAGHVILQDRTVLSGNTTVHQFCRVGRLAMISGVTAITKDLPPFFIATGFNACPAVNVVGMRRAGLTNDDVDDARWAHRMLYRKRQSVPSALEAMRERADRPVVAELIAFVESSARGICGATQSPRREAQPEEEEQTCPE